MNTGIQNSPPAANTVANKTTIKACQNFNVARDFNARIINRNGYVIVAQLKIIPSLSGISSVNEFITKNGKEILTVRYNNSYLVFAQIQRVSIH